jgi:cytochrome c6
MRTLPAAATAAYGTLLAAALALSACSPADEPAGAPASNANPPPARAAATNTGVGGTAPSAAELARAKELFSANCAECHLESGKGDPHHRKDDIPDFTNAAWQAREQNDALVAAITDGKGDAMPAFKGDLSTEEIRLLVGYVRSLSAPGSGNASGAAPPAGKAPATKAKSPAKSPSAPPAAPKAPSRNAPKSDAGGHGGHAGHP